MPSRMQQEAGALLKGLGAEAGHLEKIPAGLEGAVFVAVSHDIAGERGAEAGNVGEELLAGSVQIHAHGVDAADDHVVEAALEFGLVDVVLVLPHARWIWDRS